MPPRISDHPRGAARSSRAYSCLIVLAFAVFLYSPLIVTAHNIANDDGTDRAEKRAPTPHFIWDKAELAKLPEAAKLYFEERYGLKDSLRFLDALVTVEGFDTSTSTAVLLGREDWLFYAWENVLDYQREDKPLSDAALKHWLLALEDRRAWLAARNISYALVIPPNTHTIYPEFLPEDLARPRQSRLEQLILAKNRHAPRVHVIDLQSALLRHKPQVQLYFRHDTHWNAVAGWIASQEVASELGLPKLAGPLFPIRTRPVRGGDLARLLGLESFYVEANPWPAQIPPALETEDGNPLKVRVTDVAYGPRTVVVNPSGRLTALVFRDSFGEAMVPWLSTLFAKTIWVGYEGFSQQRVLADRPNVVIDQLVERKLMILNPQTGSP